MIGKMVRLFHFILYKSVVVWRMRTILINANVKKTYIGEVSVQKDNNSDSSLISIAAIVRLMLINKITQV